MNTAASQAKTAWNPRPHPDLSSFGRKAYFAGYSDAFHGYRFGAGDEGAFGAFSDYRPGYSDGAVDWLAETNRLQAASDGRAEYPSHDRSTPKPQEAPAG